LADGFTDRIAFASAHGCSASKTGRFACIQRLRHGSRRKTALPQSYIGDVEKKFAVLLSPVISAPTVRKPFCCHIPHPVLVLLFRVTRDFSGAH
jgi:hypothetical protein